MERFPGSCAGRTFQNPDAEGRATRGAPRGDSSEEQVPATRECEAAAQDHGGPAPGKGRASGRNRETCEVAAPRLSLRAEGPPAPHGLWGGDPKEPWAGPPELPRFLPSSGRTARSVRYAHLSATGVLGGRSLRAPRGVCATPSCVSSLSPIPGEQNASLSRDSVSEMPEGDSRPDERFWRRFQRLKCGRAAAGAGAAGPLSARRLLALRKATAEGALRAPLLPLPPALRQERTCSRPSQRGDSLRLAMPFSGSLWAARLSYVNRVYSSRARVFPNSPGIDHRTAFARPEQSPEGCLGKAGVEGSPRSQGRAVTARETRCPLPRGLGCELGRPLQTP